MKRHRKQVWKKWMVVVVAVGVLGMIAGNRLRASSAAPGTPNALFLIPQGWEVMSVQDGGRGFTVVAREVNGGTTHVLVYPSGKGENKIVFHYVFAPTPLAQAFKD